MSTATVVIDSLVVYIFHLCVFLFGAKTYRVYNMCLSLMDETHGKSLIRRCHVIWNGIFSTACFHLYEGDDFSPLKFGN